MGANLLEAITRMVSVHPAAHWVYPNGKAPLGYTKGVALVYGRVLCKYQAGDAGALFMARASTGDSEHDALSYYRGLFNKLSLDVSKDGLDTLRSVWVLVTGLAMPESSGDDETGRDLSANNVTADTAEAGAWQTSWNAAHNSGPPATGLLTALFTHYKKAFATNPVVGWADVFSEGCPPPRASELQNYGSGDGVEFQKLTKECPAFGAEFAAIVVRALRGHYGTINRYKVALNPYLADMFSKVETIISSNPAAYAAALSDTPKVVVTSVIPVTAAPVRKVVPVTATPTPNMQPELLAFAKTWFPGLDGFFPTWEPELVSFVSAQQGVIAGQVLDFVLKSARSVIQKEVGFVAPATSALPLPLSPGGTPQPSVSPGIPELVQWLNSQSPPAWAAQLFNQIFHLPTAP